LAKEERKAIFVPSGRYVITRQLNIEKQEIFGVDFETTVLEFHIDNGIAIKASTQPNIHNLAIRGIHNRNVLRNGTYLTTGVFIEDGYRSGTVSMDKIHVSNFTNGVQMSGTIRRINNSYFTGNVNGVIITSRSSVFSTLHHIRNTWFGFNDKGLYIKKIEGTHKDIVVYW